MVRDTLNRNIPEFPCALATSAENKLKKLFFGHINFSDSKRIKTIFIFESDSSVGLDLGRSRRIKRMITVVISFDCCVRMFVQSYQLTVRQSFRYTLTVVTG